MSLSMKKPQFLICVCSRIMENSWRSKRIRFTGRRLIRKSQGKANTKRKKGNTFRRNKKDKKESKQQRKWSVKWKRYNLRNTTNLRDFPQSMKMVKPIIRSIIAICAKYLKKNFKDNVLNARKLLESAISANGVLLNLKLLKMSIKTNTQKIFKL